MATDSSSGTLPSSSRLTIDSSSSIARSKGICPISLLSFWAMLAIVDGIAASAIGSCSLGVHQGSDMGGNRVAECLQVIAAFKQRDNTATGATVGHIHDLLRGPDEIGLGQIDVGERVAHMRVKAGGDDGKLRPEFLKPWQNPRLECGAERCAAIAGTQRRIDDRIVFAGLADGAGPRKQRHLMGRAIHDAFIRPEDLLRTIAVMHVKID